MTEAPEELQTTVDNFDVMSFAELMNVLQQRFFEAAQGGRPIQSMLTSIQSWYTQNSTAIGPEQTKMIYDILTLKKATTPEQAGPLLPWALYHAGIDYRAPGLVDAIAANWNVSQGVVQELIDLTGKPRTSGASDLTGEGRGHKNTPSTAPSKGVTAAGKQNRDETLSKARKTGSASSGQQTSLDNDPPRPPGTRPYNKKLPGAPQTTLGSNPEDGSLAVVPPKAKGTRTLPAPPPKNGGVTLKPGPGA